MAEVVEYRVQKILDELQPLVEFGIFENHDIKKAIKKIEDFEYSRRRRTRSKLEFLEYIRYELILLESLEKYKKHVLKENLKPKEDASEADLIERKILLLQAKKLNDVIRFRCAHISKLYRQLVLSFQFDKNLWLAYIEFTKSRKWNTRTTALYWRLLRVKSDDPDIWVAAASHEIETNKAFDTARALFLRALRHHPQHPRIWAEYFKMEVAYMNTVEKRAQVVFKTLAGLKEDAGKQSDEAVWAEDMNKERDENSDDEIVDDDDIVVDDVVEAKSESEKLAGITPVEDDAIMSGQLPRVVYNNATDTLKSDRDYNEFVINILTYLCKSSTDSRGVSSVREDIVATIKRLHEDDKDSRITTELYKGCTDEAYLEQAFANLTRKFQDGSVTKKFKKSSLSRMEILYECNESKGVEEARKLFNEMEKLPKNKTLSLYVGMIQIELWQLPIIKEDHQLDRVRAIYEKALMKFGRIKPKLWYEYLQFEHDHSKDLDDIKRINQIYQRAQATLNPDKIGKLIEKYTLMLTCSSKNDIEYSDYSDLED